MFCGYTTPEDSSQMSVVHMCFLFLIKFMDYYESSLRYLPGKKKIVTSSAARGRLVAGTTI